MMVVLCAILFWPAGTSECRQAHAAANIRRLSNFGKVTKRMSGGPSQEINAMGGLPPSEPALQRSSSRRPESASAGCRSEGTFQKPIS
jgi:hypothetical protein